MNKELLDEIETALSDTRQYAWSFARYNADKRAAGVCEDADAVLAKLREARNADGATILSNADKRPQRLLWAPANYFAKLMSKADLSVWEHLMNYVRRHALELRSLPLTAPKEDGR